MVDALFIKLIQCSLSLLYSSLLKIDGFLKVHVGNMFCLYLGGRWGVYLPSFEVLLANIVPTGHWYSIPFIRT